MAAFSLPCVKLKPWCRFSCVYEDNLLFLTFYFFLSLPRSSQLLSEEVDKVSTLTSRKRSLDAWLMLSASFLPLVSFSPPGRTRASRGPDGVRSPGWGHQAAAWRHQQHTCESPQAGHPTGLLLKAPVKGHAAWIIRVFLSKYCRWTYGNQTMLFSWWF